MFAHWLLQWTVLGLQPRWGHVLVFPHDHLHCQYSDFTTWFSSWHCGFWQNFPSLYKCLVGWLLHLLISFSFTAKPGLGRIPPRMGFLGTLWLRPVRQLEMTISHTQIHYDGHGHWMRHAKILLRMLAGCCRCWLHWDGKNPLVEQLFVLLSWPLWKAFPRRTK